MELEAAIRSRRTHKAYGPEPVPRSTLDELFELARWAPNHHLTNPWRFRVVGDETLSRLCELAGPLEGQKLRRAPTLVVVSAAQGGEDPAADEEDVLAVACAAYIVLLGVHARGLAGYWRTPVLIQTPEARAALGVPASDRVLGMLYLGRPRQEQPPPAKADPGEFVSYLP